MKRRYYNRYNSANRAASLMERMEVGGIVGPGNHAGKREILVEDAVG
ncbi:hypothetical protein MKK69_27060 [Methylobacterium sp. J-026]|nr:DNA translocase FtsK [Methylobacterium sp. J-026]MCJ2137662.1 hypothetical protein [Methylobacterium sp. J-026]